MTSAWVAAGSSDPRTGSSGSNLTKLARRAGLQRPSRRAIAIYDILEENSFALVDPKGRRWTGRSISICVPKAAISV